MNLKLFFQATIKFLLGAVLVGLLVFLPAGTINFFNGWLFMAVLFVPMFVAGIVMMLKNPHLLKKRLNAKEKKHAIMHVYRSDRKNIYVDVLWKMCEYVTKKYLSTVFPDVQLSDYDRQLITRYFKCSCFGLTIDWIKAGMKDEYIEDMHRILQQSKGVADLIIKNCIESQQ